MKQKIVLILTIITLLIAIISKIIWYYTLIDMYEKIHMYSFITWFILLSLIWLYYIFKLFDGDIDFYRKDK